ncbi:hypothetical protein [Actinosynnema sp. NPDC020468]|uniref:hypothetical protein n=1 Tax=Actinosynnema sp. NPDC020468 TaxID=3154488 RepID=UPI00340E5A81
MWRSVLAVCFFVLASTFTVGGTAVAAQPAPVAVAHLVAQPSDTVTPTATGPDINAPQAPAAGVSSETKNKLWAGGIAVVLFGLVYLRNRRRWSNWRKARKK